MRRPLAFLAPLLVVAPACGGSTPPPVTEPPPEPVAAAPVSPWDAAASDHAATARQVEVEAIARAHEEDPSVDLSQRAAWLANPDAAPAFGDRVSERLLQIAGADVARGEFARAAETIRLVRAKARNRNRAFAANTLLAVVTRLAHANEPAEAQTAAVRAVFAELPRARFGMSTVAFYFYQEASQIAAAREQLRSQLASLDTLSEFLFVEHVLADIVANRALYIEVIDAQRATHDAAPPATDYAFGTVDLARARDAQPVHIAVWDTGTAPELFGASGRLGDRLFTNTHEQPNGQDDDGNGLVDDIHGVVSDVDAAQTDLVYRPSAATLTDFGPFLRGVMDLRAGIPSSESAQRVLALMRSATDAASLDRLDTNLGAIGEWAHGSHVAGIMLQGIPQARISVFRSAWAGEQRPYHHRGPTDAELDLERANVDQIGQYIRAHGVRVVNASLGFEEEYVEGELRYETSVYSDEASVRARAHAVQLRRRENWASIFAACPDTLFVIAAGNSNHDVMEYADVASSIQAPNVLVVGAVDRFGAWATFTNSNPEQVRIFDHGVDVDSTIPNGETVPLSGTSMASPNVANLAAKLISVDPSLTPARAITVITETADPIAAPFNGGIANETRAIERVRRERPRGRRAAR